MSDALKLENQLCHRFYAVSNAFTRAYRPLLSALDITYPQYVVMMALWEHDGIPIAQLLEKTRIDGGAMSLMLKKLEAKGYIQVRPHEKDKRSRCVYLTDTGMHAKETAEPIPQQMLCKVDGLSRDEANMLIHLIDKLSDSLDGAICQVTR